MKDRIITWQTEVENLIRRNKMDVDSIKCDISDAKSELKAIRNNLDEIKLNTEKSMDAVADLKVENNTTVEAIAASSQTAAALKKEYTSLLDKINMTSGKLNVLETRMNNLKDDVYENSTKQQHQQRIHYRVKTLQKLFSRNYCNLTSKKAQHQEALMATTEMNPRQKKIAITTRERNLP